MTSNTPRKDPDAAALAQYRRRAAHYDLELAAFEPIRRLAIAALAPAPGEVVLDLGCGTGLSFEGLLQGVGPQGRVIGIEQCPEMLAHARQRVRARRWANVTLLGCPVAAAPIPQRATLALFHFTHDILRDPAALDHVLRHLEPGARVVASGLKWAPLWAVPTNLFVLGAALHSVSSLDGLDQPWSELATRVGALDVQALMLGGAYLASGRVA